MEGLRLESSVSHCTPILSKSLHQLAGITLMASATFGPCCSGYCIELTGSQWVPGMGSPGRASLGRTLAPALPRTVQLQGRARRKADQGRPVFVAAEYRREGGASEFMTGFLLGGLLFGTLGAIFAPQLSRTILGENADGTPRRLPRWLDEDDSLEATRRKMNEKIAELNLAIDNTSAALRAEDENSLSSSENLESAA